MALRTFDLSQDDPALLWLDWGCVEGTRILEHLRLVEVEQRPAVLVLLVKVHRLQPRRRTGRVRKETGVGQGAAEEGPGAGDTGW